MNGISVITICYNNKDGLQRTIESVLAQDFNDIEYIIIDGGSTDGSQELIRQYEEHINLFVSEPDNGIYDALNKGIRKASKEWIICMNAGDIFTDSKVLSNIMSSEIPEDKDAIYSDFWSCTADGKRFLCHTDRETGTLIHQSCIYKRRLHEDYGYYLVTKPYIVSDLIFLISIPKEKYLKVPYCISVNAYGGVSQNGTWCTEGALGLKTAFRIENMNSAYIKYLKFRLSTMLPERCKDIIRKYILRKTFIEN